MLWRMNVTAQGLKPVPILHCVRGPEGPLFHGDAGIHGGGQMHDGGQILGS